MVESFGDYLFNNYPREDNFILIVKNNWGIFAVTLAKAYIETISYSTKLIELEKAKKLEMNFSNKFMKTYFRLRYLFCKWE